MTTIPLDNTNTNTSSEPTPSPQYEADARAKIAALRVIAADFTSPEPRSLTDAEKRLISATPRPFVEKAVNFGVIAPVVGQASKADLADMGDGEAYASAYGLLIDELESTVKLVRKAVALRRLKSSKSARSIYRMAKSYVLTEGGDDVETHVQEMKKALRRRPRTAAATPASPPTTPKPPEPPK